MPKQPPAKGKAAKGKSSVSKPSVALSCSPNNAVNSTSAPAADATAVRPSPSAGTAVVTPSPSSPKLQTASASGTTSSSATLSRRTFREALAGKGSTTTVRDPWSRPGNLPKCRPPKVCEVKPNIKLDPDFQNLHDGLDNNLARGNLVPWTRNPGPGYFMFTKWGEMCGDMYYDLAERGYRFRRHKHFANIARVPTNIFTARRIGGKAGRYHLYIGSRAAICLSMFYCKKTQLIAPEGEDLRQKYVLGIPMFEDFDMFQAAVCNVFHQQSLSTQLGYNALQISTRTDFEMDDPARDAKKTFFSQDTSEPSPRASSTTVRDNGFTLDNTADVPVYDLRLHPEFNFADDLERIHLLPRWEDEIPEGACIVVGYTVGTYITKGLPAVEEDPEEKQADEEEDEDEDDADGNPDGEGDGDVDMED